MGSFSVWHLLIIIIVSLPAFLPLVIKPLAGNRFGPVAQTMGMRRAVEVCMRKYFNFKERASRSEFWWFQLFCLIMNVALAILDYASGTAVFSYASLALIVPAISVATRRLHDINRSGWWQLLSFIGFGWFVLVYLWAQPPQNDLEEKAAAFD